MELQIFKIKEIYPYERNARKNDKAVDAVAKSIEQCSYVAPIVVDENHVILAGHTRWKALQKLGRTECECIVKSGLTEEQKRKYRLLDNKTNELAEWNMELLQGELEGLDFEDLDLDWGLTSEKKENPYTAKVKIPQYEITGDQPDISSLYDETKANDLIEEIQESGVSEEEKEFLIEAAKRHVVFNYKKIAEYYAHADKEMQELMEKSALVIIDYGDAIANGYVKLSDRLNALRGSENA